MNDHLITGKSASGEVSVGQLNKNQVKVTVNKKKTANLKPGQVYDPNSGKIYDHISEAPKPFMVEEEPESIGDKVSKKLASDEPKKIATEPIDILPAKPNSLPASVENK